MKLIESLKSKIKKDGKSLAVPVGVFIFALGFCIMLYPFVGQILNYTQSQKVIQSFDKAKQEMPDKEVQRRIRLAQAYNSSLSPGSLYDPFTDKEKYEGRREYAKMIEIREKIGHIKIPKIHEDIPIYAGTSEEVLQKGVGHLEGTSLPIGGKNTHSVLSAHRGLPTARLFTDLDKLEANDIFYIYNIEKKLAYKVDKISVVEPTDFSKINIEKGKDYVTLLTCTPYMINSHRLLVRGHRVSIKEAEREEKDGHYGLNPYLKRFILLLLLLIASIIFFMKLSKYIEKKRKESDEVQNK